MKHLTLYTLGTFLIATLIVAAPSVTAKQTFAAPGENGKIERLDLNQQELVIGDTLYKFASGVAVYTYRGFQTSVSALKKGQHIAFNVTRDAAGSSYVSVIWILSKK